MIRQGLADGQRPTAVLLHDPYAGHRDWDDPFWMPDPVRDTQWTDWDYSLAEAIVALDMLTNPAGQPKWLSEDPDVYWDIGTSVDFAVKTLADETDKYKNGVPPEVTHYVKNPHKNGEFWTMMDWLAWREEQEGKEPRLDRNAPEGAHPPLPEDYIEMKRLRDERIRAKYAEADDEAAEDDSVN